ncbi:MAG: hypothetical protein PHH59_15715 [Methylovulum sp.]|uniref:hypothetical protein n=1 Tax=Methylovulum sp. TaxID=1916980 RepID=UPI002618532B|nr:hypothetical protein [Methylovulum sp.]MDD2725453.1 hypothetical protein [Methylovulum sp.]MDD5125179.1 hypothetical protein [Methylovulum sp.]
MLIAFVRLKNPNACKARVLYLSFSIDYANFQLIVFKVINDGSIDVDAVVAAANYNDCRCSGNRCWAGIWQTQDSGRSWSFGTISAASVV